MELTYLSAAINILLITAFVIDRLYRIKSIKEYKEAKEAQIDSLKQRLEIEKSNNDVEIAEMHKKRYENLKLIVQEKDSLINNYRVA